LKEILKKFKVKEIYCCVALGEVQFHVTVLTLQRRNLVCFIQSGAWNVIPLIVHMTNFYYY